MQTHSTFSQSVMVCVSKLGLIDLIFVDAGVKINGTYYWNILLTQKHCLQCVRSVPYSLPSNNAMLLLLLTEHERQSTSWNDRYQSCFHFTTSLAPNSTDLNPLDYKRWAEMQQRVYQVHNVDELKQHLINVWHGVSKVSSMTQTSLCGYSCENMKFWAFKLTLYNAYFILPIIFVNFLSIKQVLLCYLQQNFAIFGLSCFAR